MRVQDILTALYFCNSELIVVRFTEKSIIFFNHDKEYIISTLIANYYNILKRKPITEYSELYDERLVRGCVDNEE